MDLMVYFSLRFRNFFAILRKILTNSGLLNDLKRASKNIKKINIKDAANPR
jgi:hypothetical protein